MIGAAPFNASGDGFGNMNANRAGRLSILNDQTSGQRLVCLRSGKALIVSGIALDR
jgi:hypothetical protein